jgi:hypothetical protein
VDLFTQEMSPTRSRIHEHTISLRFLVIILRVLRLEVSVWIRIRINWIWIRIRIWIQYFKWIQIRIRNQIRMRIRIQFRIQGLMRKTEEKNTTEIFKSFFSALKREHWALRKMKFFNFFLRLWVIFALLDPYPDPDCESGYGSRDPVNPDSDPQHWIKPNTIVMKCTPERWPLPV